MPPEPDQVPNRRAPARGAPPSLAAALLLALALAPAAAPAVAQQQQQQRPAGNGGGGGGGEPIEIVSDALTVEQEKRLATFTGNVDAVQGDLRLRADKLLVHYDQDGDDGGGGSGGGGAQQGQAAPPGGDQGSIRRIEAIGNVVVVRPGETAKGDRGTYEPGSGAMTLEGDVVLTRGQNVVRGARLESNERTGVSTVFAAAPGAVRQPGQRVRALFVRGAERPQGQGAGTGAAQAAGGAPAPAPPAAGAAPRKATP